VSGDSYTAQFDGIHQFSDENVHKRWAQRRAAQAPESIGHLFAIFGWLMAISPVSTLAQVSI